MINYENFTEIDVNRGDIFYVSIPHQTGWEIKKDRPAVVVSSQKICRTRNVVSVVFLTGSLEGKFNMDERVVINSTPRQKSIALCEAVYSVDKSRLLSFVGRVTDEEMDEIDNAISIGMFAGRLSTPSPVKTESDDTVRIARAEAERDIYKDLYTKLLRTVKGV